MDIVEKLTDVAVYARQHRVPILSLEKAGILSSYILKYKPKRILELGTAIGYSTTILGQCGAQVVTIDRDKRAQEYAKGVCSFFSIAVSYIFSDGIEALQKLVTEKSVLFDFIFLDFEKKRYIDALPYCLSLLKPGGRLLADNMLDSKCVPFIERLKTEDDFFVVEWLHPDMVLIEKR